MSMKPGATTNPLASTFRLASFSSSRPIAAILPSLMATSATYDDVPEPSTTRPPLMTTSKRCSSAAAEIPAQLAAIKAIPMPATANNRTANFIRVPLWKTWPKGWICVAAWQPRRRDTINVNQAHSNCEQQECLLLYGRKRQILTRITRLFPNSPPCLRTLSSESHRRRSAAACCPLQPLHNTGRARVLRRLFYWLDFAFLCLIIRRRT